MGILFLLFMVFIIYALFYLNAILSSDYKSKSQLKKELKISPNWPTTRELMFRLARYKCEKCGSSYNLQVHHKIPKSLGGTDDFENLTVLCKSCHEKLHGYKIENPSYKFDSYDSLVDLFNESTTKVHNSEIISNKVNKHKNTKYEELQKAVNQNEILNFKYTKYEGDVSYRTVKPIHVYLGKNNRQYLRAFDYSRNDERLFRISRITKIIHKK